MIQVLPAFPWSALLIGTVLVAALALFRARGAWWVAALSLGLSGLGALSLFEAAMVFGRAKQNLGGWPPPWGLELSWSMETALLAALFTFLPLLLWGSPAADLNRTVSARWKTPALYLLFPLGCLVAFGTKDALGILIGLELAALALAGLMALGQEEEGAFHALKFLLNQALGSGLYLLGLGYLYSLTGTFQLGDLAGQLPGIHPATLVKGAFLFMTLGLLLKAGIIPLRGWMGEEPAEAGAALRVLSGVLYPRACAWILLNLWLVLFQAQKLDAVLHEFRFLHMLLVLALVLFSFAGFLQRDVRKFLGFLNAAQWVSLLAACRVPGLELGVAALALLAQGLSLGGLHLALGILEGEGKKPVEFQSAGYRWPVTMACLVLCAIPLAAVPGTLGWVIYSSWIRAAAQEGMWVFALVLGASVLLNGVYFVGILLKAWGGEVRRPSGESTIPLSSRWPLWVVTAALVVLGLFCFRALSPLFGCMGPLVN